MAKKEALFKFNQMTIAQVADTLFREQGISKTTMDEIAKIAGYSKTTIYTYFKSKEDLVLYLGVQGLTDLVKELGVASLAGDSVVATLLKSWWIVADFQKNYDLYYDQIMTMPASEDVPQHSQSTWQTINLLQEKINRLFLNLLDKGVYEGVLRAEVNNIATRQFLWASLQGILHYADTKTGPLRLTSTQRPEFLTQSYDLLLRSILK
ncbi:TetR/AcrR family transcriptional regulator [Periweissella cryptocerci]|nr:TetR/AcrR family transcriptional regulator [Periweissella cryptocerci]